MRRMAWALIAELILLASPAWAEMPTYAYIGLNCAKSSSGALDAAVLFTTRQTGFQDGDSGETFSIPAFPILPPAVDHGLSSGWFTVPGAKGDQAICGGWPINILVRHGASPLEDEDNQEWISVWVNERKILSRFKIEYDTDPKRAGQPRDAGLLIIDGKVRLCPHDAAKAADCKLLGDIATMGVMQAPYVQGGIAPGRLAATFAADQKLCNGLVKLGALPDDPQLSYLNKPDNRDESYYLAPPDQDAISFRDAQPILEQPYDFKDESGLPLFISTAVYDLRNSGKPQLVVNVGDDSHYMTGNYLVSIPLTKISPDIIKAAATLSGSLDEDNIPPALFQKGWRLFSAKGTQYTAARYSQMMPARVNGTTYILVTSNATSWKAKGDDSVALLMKPEPDGSMKKMCEYHRGQPIY